MSVKQKEPKPHGNAQASSSLLGPASSKSEERRTALALHTLAALAELGYARLNLREVAARSGVSLGVIHYYFEDKAALLSYSVSLYKDEFVQRLRQCIGDASSVKSLSTNFAELLARSVKEHGHTHRLWYDMRAQAQFEAAFEPVVCELELRLTDVVQELLIRMDALGRSPSLAHRRDALSLYLELDSWFRYCLQQSLKGDARAPDLLRAKVLLLLN